MHQVQGKYCFLLFLGWMINTFSSLDNVFISFLRLKINFLEWLHRTFSIISVSCKLYDQVCVFSKAFGSNESNSLVSLAVGSNPSEMWFLCFTFGITESSHKVGIHTLMSPLKWSGNERENGVAFTCGKLLIPRFVIVSNKQTSYCLKPRISASDL